MARVPTYASFLLLLLHCSTSSSVQISEVDYHNLGTLSPIDMSLVPVQVRSRLHCASLCSRGNCDKFQYENNQCYRLVGNKALQGNEYINSKRVSAQSGEYIVMYCGTGNGINLLHATECGADAKSRYTDDCGARSACFRKHAICGVTAYYRCDATVGACHDNVQQITSTPKIMQGYTSRPFVVGRCMYIRARPAKYNNPTISHMWIMKLMTMNMDALFYMEIRFNYNGDTNVVILNQQISGVMGVEERPSAFPFSPDQVFEMTVENQNLGFDVKVNGNAAYFFNHRITDFSQLQLLEFRNLHSSVVDIELLEMSFT